MDYKTIISVIAVVLAAVGYAPYIRDIFKKKTTPHTFTFFIWGFSSLITYALQVIGGAGVGSWVTLAASLICIFIFFLGLKYGEKKITRSDVVFFILSLVALFLWLVVKQPVWSVALIVSVDLLGFAPTIRKSWNKPYSETLFTYELCVFRHGLSILALQQFNILTLLYPVAWTLANLFFSIYLIVRRKQISSMT
jgi:hypothetical protein